MTKAKQLKALADASNRHPLPDVARAEEEVKRLSALKARLEARKTELLKQLDNLRRDIPAVPVSQAWVEWVRENEVETIPPEQHEVDGLIARALELVPAPREPDAHVDQQGALQTRWSELIEEEARLDRAGQLSDRGPSWAKVPRSVPGTREECIVWSEILRTYEETLILLCRARRLDGRFLRAARNPS